MKSKQIFKIILLMLLLILGLNCEKLFSAGESYIFTEFSEVRPDTTRSADKRSDAAGRISVTQQGSGNTATIRQIGSPDGKTEASVKMTGSGNTTELSFNGVRSDAEVDITGEDNLLLIRPLSVFDIFTIQFRKNLLETDSKDESPRDFMMIFRNLENTLGIHHHSADSLINTDQN